MHNKAIKAASNENTLNRWAGYDITIDEVSTLKLKLENLSSSLIKEVGSYVSMDVMGAKLYDVGGNVAEYGTNGDIYGYSAYDFVDQHNANNATSNHVGFRVVLETSK